MSERAADRERGKTSDNAEVLWNDLQRFPNGEPIRAKSAQRVVSALAKSRRMESFFRYQAAIPLVFTGAGFGAVVCGAFAVAPLWVGFLGGGVVATLLTAALYAAEEAEY